MRNIFHFAANDTARLYAESGAAALSVSLAEFAAWLPEKPTQCPHVKDLVLARACANGNPAAWDCFVALYRPKLYAAATAITRDETTGRELADSLYADLYGNRKLHSFQGRGSLEAWLKTILAQEWVNRLRRERKLVAFDDSLETPIEADRPAPSTHQQSLAAATDTALGQLDPADRVLLASYYLDQRTLAEIGRMLGMHESTVSRKLDKITAHLRKQIVTELAKAAISKRAAEEMLASDVRDLDINVREKLAQERNA